MKKEELTQRLRSWLRKAATYKYALAILLLGVGLLLLPGKEKTAAADAVHEDVQPQTDLEADLEVLLSQVEGAGRVRVLLTLEAGTAYTYQTDRQTSTGSSGTESREETVLVSAGSGQEQAVPVQTIYPTYKGAVVVCEGADRASVRLAIIQAVASLTGLGSDKITVIKMKGN